MKKNELISGLILAGGRGSRMGHVDKGLQPFRGKTMVAHVLERLAPAISLAGASYPVRDAPFAASQILRSITLPSAASA